MKTLTLLFLLLLYGAVYGGDAPPLDVGEKMLSDKVCRFLGVSEDCPVGSSEFNDAIQKVLNDCSTIQSFLSICIKGSDEAEFSVRFMYVSRSIIVVWIKNDGDYTVVAKVVVKQSSMDKSLTCVRSSLFTLPRQPLLDQIEIASSITAEGP